MFWKSAGKHGPVFTIFFANGLPLSSPGNGGWKYPSAWMPKDGWLNPWMNPEFASLRENSREKSILLLSFSFFLFSIPGMSNAFGRFWRRRALRAP